MVQDHMVIWSWTISRGQNVKKADNSWHHHIITSLHTIFSKSVTITGRESWCNWSYAMLWLIHWDRSLPFIHFSQIQWRSRGAEGRLPPGRNSAPLLPPNEITRCTEVYGEPPFWVPVSPLLTPEPPLPSPHFEKPGYAHAPTMPIALWPFLF